MKIFTTCICMLFFTCAVSAQTITVSGRVTDAQTGEPLIGVAVLEKSTSNGVSTNLKGQYQISVKSDSAALVFTIVGFGTQTEKVKGRQEINVALKPVAHELNEVVVTALGIQREKRELGYAVQKLEALALTEVRETNLVNALAGKVAGVQITNGASGVGSSSRIVIRGETSLSGTNQPLFVIDGVPISNTHVANNTENNETGFQEVDYGNGAADISPDDIESITVLKGAGAAALYGSRAANGVIVISTKNGVRKKGIGVSINSGTTIQTLLTLPDYQNEYGSGAGGRYAYEDGLGAGINDGGITSFGPKMEGQLIRQYNSPATDKNGNPVFAADVIARGGSTITPTPFLPNPGNIKDFFQTGQTLTNNISLSGATEQSSFRLSFSNLDNKGIIPNTDFKRSGLAFTGDHQFTDKLSARTFVNFINSSSNNRPGMGYGSENPMYTFIWMGRQVEMEPLKNYWQAGQKDFSQFNFNYRWLDNPYFSMYENTNGFNKDRLLGNAQVTYLIADNLNIRFRSGMDYYQDLRQSKRAFSSQRFKNGAYREDEVAFKETNTDVLVTYLLKPTPEWNLSFSVGGNTMNQETRYKSTTAGQLSVPNIYNFENSKIPLVTTQQVAGKRIHSVLGIGNFSYRSWLFLDFTLRNDWSSTLPTNNNSYPYYSASFSTLLSEILPVPAWMSFSKVRLSAARVGNDTDPFQLTNTFAFNGNYGSSPLVTNASRLLNAGLKPERLNALEAGGEVWFWSDRVGLDFSIYQNTSTDQIIKLPASAASGYLERVVNGGKIRSRGLELVLQAVPVKAGSFRWNNFVNFSRNVSHVLELPAGVQQYVTGSSSIYTNPDNSVFFIAAPHFGTGGKKGRIGDIYGTGLQEVDGQVVYDAKGIPVRDSKLRLLGNYNPDFILGLGNEFSYKNLGFSFLFDWRQGGTIVSRTLAIGSTSGVLKSTLPGRETGVTGPGITNIGTASEPNYVPNTTSIAASDFYGQYNNRANEATALYDASYVKLRQVKLSYRLPATWTDKLKMSEAKVSLIGSNLLLFTQNPHFDPELNALQGRNFAYGVENLSLPSSRSFGFNFNLTF